MAGSGVSGRPYSVGWFQNMIGKINGGNTTFFLRNHKDNHENNSGRQICQNPLKDNFKETLIIWKQQYRTAFFPLKAAISIL